MTKYIAIDGKGGSGKTYLSEILAKRLHAPVIHLDKYGSDFVPFVGIPVFSDIIAETKADIVIFEGVGAFDARLDKFNAVKVFANPPSKLRRRRLEQRDVPRIDRSEADWKKIDKIWAKAEKKYFNTTQKKKADLVVKTLDAESDVTTIVNIVS